MSVIYTQGGAASVADATTTVSGKVRLATIAEAGGTSEAIAVTPAGLQAEISGLASGLVYRGSIDVADFATTLANAELGDYYKISTGGTSGGVVYAVGDSIIVNADMGGTFSDAKLDRIDNVDPSTSDEITGNHNATSYTATNTDTLTTHLSAIDAELGAFATVATSGSYNDLADKPSADDLAADHVAVNYTAGDVNIDDHLAGIDTALGALGGFSSIVASNTVNVVAIDANTFVTLSSNNSGYPWKISVPASPSDGDAIALTVASGSDGEQANTRTSIEVYADDQTTLLHTLNSNARRTLWIVYESASTSWLASPSYDALKRGSASSTTLTASTFGFEELHIMERDTGDYPLTLPAAADVELGQVQIIRLRGPRNLAITSAASDIVDPTETNYSLSASNTLT